jgi:two-component system alkaline phosphatase synthesis response regulator PhoP
MKKQRILLVDDDETITMTFEHQLIEAGFDVDTAESGEKAIVKLDKNSSYDLVITDLRMYGETGVDVFKKVREINVNTPVMFMSGFSIDSPLYKEALELKPCGNMIKPFPKKEFLAQVHACLAKAN